MIKSSDAVALAKNSVANGNVANAKKDAIVAGGVALRAMAKGGKFANASDNDNDGVIATAIKGAAVSAVTKVLDTLTIAIRKTVDLELEIIEVVLEEGNAEAGDGKEADALGARGANVGDAGKLFGNTGNDGAVDSSDNAKKAGADASKAIGAVTGADILQAISSKGNGDAAKLAKHNVTAQVTGVAFDVKDAVITGGIALRAMAKGGKFANEKDAANNDVVTVVKGAAVSAVTKALDTLTIAIRKTIDLGLNEVKEAMKINTNDIPVISDKTTPKA